MTQVKTPHKHAEVIKAWADGDEIEFRFNSGCEWDVIDGTPSWDERRQYRIKPTKKMAWYRVAETKNGTWTTSEESDIQHIESSSNFIRWLTDRIEYEVTE